MPASVNLQSQICNLKSALVRLGHLCFDDFLLVAPETLDFRHWTPDLTSDWMVALNNAPDLVLHFRRSVSVLTSSFCNLASDFVPLLEQVRAAQSRLVHAFAYELLRAKAPPLYDALPWQDWDFSIIAKRFRLWQTRFLLAGDGTTVTMCRCRKSAGVYVLEPNETIARYIERKAALEKVRRFRLLHSSPTPSLPLPSNSVDLAILGSCPELETGNWKLVTAELLRVSANVLLIENSPLAPPLDQSWLAALGFVSETVEVRGLGPRPCHWKLSQGVGRSHGQNL
jgi:SAM-dependent methyltransferase